MAMTGRPGRTTSEGMGTARVLTRAARRVGLACLSAAMVGTLGCEWLSPSERDADRAAAEAPVAQAQPGQAVTGKVATPATTQPAGVRVPEDVIREAIGRLRNEAAQIKIVGRAIFPHEERRLGVISAALPRLEKALAVLEKGVADEPGLVRPALPATRPARVARTQPAEDRVLKPVADLVRRAIRQLEGESGRIQIVGRPLSPDEQQRVRVLGAAMVELRQALQILETGSAGKASLPAP